MDSNDPLELRYMVLRLSRQPAVPKLRRPVLLIRQMVLRLSDSVAATALTSSSDSGINGCSLVLAFLRLSSMLVFYSGMAT